MCVAAPAGGPGAGAGEGELSDPHGGGGGREQRRQRHRRFGEQTSGKDPHTHTLSHILKSVLNMLTLHTLTKSIVKTILKHFWSFSLLSWLPRRPLSLSLPPSVGVGSADSGCCFSGKTD